MIQAIADRLRRRDEGFTLIELMVVVLIIGILIAIAIPTFLGARKRAQDRAAQSSLRNTVTAAKTIYTDQEKYMDATATVKDCSAVATYADRLHCGEPSLTFEGAAGTASTGANDMSVNAPDNNNFYAAALSASGTCWLVHDGVSPSGNPGTQWAQTTAANCNGTYGPGLANINNWASTPGAAPTV